jgi:phosphatidylglycerophosphate synthase
VALLIVNWPMFSVPLGKLILAVAIVLSLASGVDYFQKFWRRIDLAE